MFDGLQTALDAIPTAIFLYRPDQVLYANRAAAALTGFPQDELIGLCFHDLFDGADETGSRNARLKTRTGSLAITLTSEEIDFEGARVWLMTALKRDVPEAVLNNGQELFGALFENTIMGIAVVDAEGHYVQANRTYGEIYGYDADELIGQHFTIIFPLENDLDAYNRHARFIRGEVPTGRKDWTGVRKDGETIQVSTFNTLYIAPNGERFRVSMVMDITPHNRTREALEKNQERLSSILNSMGDGVWTIAADSYQMIYANPALESLTGYSLEDFQANPQLLIEIVHPDDREKFVAELKRVIEEKWVELDHRIIRRDGAVRWIHKRFWFTPNEERNIISGLFIDVTDRRLAAEQADQLKLENERVRILSNFVRDASHEFRTPLAVINMRLELMERTTDPAQYLKYIGRIKGQTDRILQLVEALILMSRLDNQTGLALERVDLNQILQELKYWMESSAAKGELDLTLDLSPEVLPIQGEIHELVHAFTAIFENAVAFTRPGGSIVVRSYVLNAEEIAVEMQDTGIGIDAAHLSHIFERFYRADQAHSTQGFGLGLPIARRILELHHGRIEVESSPGKGSRFRLIFPMDGAIGD